jgi:hypothetical protein
MPRLPDWTCKAVYQYIWQAWDPWSTAAEDIRMADMCTSLQAHDDDERVACQPAHQQPEPEHKQMAVGSMIHG